jgi:hypothetical protein
MTIQLEPAGAIGPGSHGMTSVLRQGFYFISGPGKEWIPAAKDVSKKSCYTGDEAVLRQIRP